MKKGLPLQSGGGGGGGGRRHCRGCSRGVRGPNSRMTLIAFSISPKLMEEVCIVATHQIR